MNEENNNGQELPDKLAKKGMDEAKKAGKQATKKLAKEALKAAMKLISKLVAVLGAKLLIIVLVIVIIMAFFGAIDHFLDDLSADSINNVTYQAVKDYCTIDDTGVHLNKEECLKAIIAAMSENGIDLNELGLGDDANYKVHGSSNTVDGNDITIENIDINSQAAQFLYKFLSASLATEFPYIEGSDEEVQGIIKIKRKIKEDEEAKDLKFIGYQKFQNMLKTTDNAQKEEIINYFSLDENWNLCIAKPYKQTTNGVLTTFTISEVKIPYKNMVAQYGVPFLFLIDLQLITNNANYVEAVAELMTKQSHIEFTIFDQITTDTNIYTYNATNHTKTKVDETSGAAEGNDIYSTSSTSTNYSSEIITETDSIKANVTKAKTWIIEQETNYSIQEQREYPYGESGTTKETSETEPEGEGSWKDPIKEYWYQEIIIREWTKSGDTKTLITPNEFMGLWANETGTYVKGAPYKAVGYGKVGKIVEYNMLNGSYNKDRPIINIVTAREQLYSLLEKPETQMLSEIMKELINIYMNGEELTENSFVTSGFTSMYEPFEFVEGSYTGDFDVHDESLFITDLETLKKAFSGGYSRSEKLVANAQAFLDMQEKYKVNAIFAAAVSITETSAGRAGNAINGHKNWFNIKDGNGNWEVYASEQKGIEAFGIFISGAGATKRYYPEGNYTVGTIGPIYCPNSTDYPTQAEDWVATTLAQISRFYEAAGIDIGPILQEGAGFEGAAGEGYRGIYTTKDGKTYIEYLQYAGPWAPKYFYGGTMKSSGCSITSVAVILSGFGIDVNPEDIRQKYPNGVNLESLIESYGLKCEVKEASKTNKNEILFHLKRGYPVIINAGGYWTNSTGHYFPVLEALGGDKVYVSNVGSSTKTGEYSIDKVFESNKKVLYISK